MHLSLNRNKRCHFYYWNNDASFLINLKHYSSLYHYLVQNYEELNIWSVKIYNASRRSRFLVLWCHAYHNKKISTVIWLILEVVTSQLDGSTSKLKKNTNAATSDSIGAVFEIFAKIWFSIKKSFRPISWLVWWM